jgi:hypothetical protein
MMTLGITIEYNYNKMPAWTLYAHAECRNKFRTVNAVVLNIVALLGYERSEAVRKIAAFY